MTASVPAPNVHRVRAARRDRRRLRRAARRQDRAALRRDWTTAEL
jgi:hypothetical protein